MRKLLLASAAILGATGGLAMAQVAPAPSQGMMMAPYGAGPSPNTNNNAWADPHTVSGSAAAGGLSGYGSQGGTSYTVPNPGTVVIRLGGKVLAEVSAGSGSLSTYTNAAGATYKVNPVNIGSYMRLYPGFDGMSANGIRYGAAIELRENWQNAQAGNGTATGGGTPVSASANTSAQTVMVRRAFTYLASDKAGLVRFGQGDGLISLFDNCIFSSQCWDAGVGVFQSNIFGGFYPTNASGGGAVNFPWLAQAGAEYGNNKIVYLTPQFYGFDFGVQYAPNQGNANQNAAGNIGTGGTQIATGTPSDALIGITSGTLTNRWINQWAVGGRYEHTFDNVDVKAYGVYMGAGHESAPITSAALNLMPISLYQGGLAVTTQGLTAAVTFQGGNVDNQLGLLQSGGAKMKATVVGLTYLNGPWTAGVTAGFIDSQGAQGALVGVTQRHQFELSVGGNYKLAPGVNLVLEYGYYQTHQGNFNFAGGANPAAYNDVKTQAIDFGTMLTW